MALRLIIEDDEGTTTVVPLGADAITIGRQQGNTIQLTEKNVSRRHARLFPEPDEDAWSIEDLGSYNGVKVNGAAVEARIELKEGDVVQIGDYHLTLTENADKTAVAPNPTAAANDTGAPEEPLLASSSTDLPRLSTEDLAALQSGPVPVQPIDSGAVPAVAGPTGFEEERKSSTGLLIGAGAVVVGALVLALAWMAGSGNDDTASDKVASADKPKVLSPAGDAKTMAQADPNAGLEPGVVEPEPGVVPDPMPNAAANPVAEAPDPEPVAPEPEPAVDDPDPTPAATASKSKPRKPRKPKSDGGTKKTPPPPKPPAVDTAALLSEAKKASFSNFPKCYDLAKKAYDASRSSEAAYRMGVCACKMGDAGKAKKSAAKLRGSKREQIAKLCEPKGITL